MLIDTHAHLNFKDYQDDLEPVIKRAVKEGVTKIICVSSNLAESEKAIAIAKKYPQTVFAAIGIHPQQTDPENKKTVQVQIQELEKLAENKEVVALGECGLDYSLASPAEKDRSHEEQFFLFQKQIKLAKKLNLPLLVHCRKATEDTIKVLKGHFNQLNNRLAGIWHCYYAGKKEVATIEQSGFYFGITGNLTYDPGLQNVVKEIPLEKIVLETDCPFLSPEPHRGLRNEPKNVKIIAECLARIKAVPFTRIAEITTKNAEDLFKV